MTITFNQNQVQLANNELKSWGKKKRKKKCFPPQVPLLGSKAFQQDGFPVDHEDPNMPKICNLLISPGETYAGTLTSHHPNHNMVSAPREESKSPLLKCVIYGLQKAFQTPDSTGMSSEINCLILSGSIHLSEFFTQCSFFFSERHVQKRNFIQGTQE